MKRLAWLTVILLFFIVAGCNEDDEKVTKVEDDIAVEQNDQDVTQENEFSFDFTHFDLDVDYSETEEFSVDYESEQNGVEAEIKDERNNKRVTGDEAFNELKPIFEQFTFDANTAEEEVISEVVNAFELDENYRKFELDVRFSDGTTKHYEQTK